MNRKNASFTFLSRVEEIELNVGDERWQSALALALTLPDICGGIAFPDLVKKYRDGRVRLDRQNQPARDVGGQYIRWFDQYAAEFFRIHPEDPAPYICGERCWQLRCEYLHQNKGFLNDEGDERVRFHLGLNCGTSVCQADRGGFQKESPDIRIDIEQFCIRMCKAARHYYNTVSGEKDFSLYNTPVLDFIQTKQGTTQNPLIAIVCASPVYAQGLQMGLKPISDQVLIFGSGEEARKKLGKRKPVVWIVSERMLEKTEEQPWRSGMNRPVILLTEKSRRDWTGEGQKEPFLEKNNGRLTILSTPVSLEALRDGVNQYLL